MSDSMSVKDIETDIKKLILSPTSPTGDTASSKKSATDVAGASPKKKLQRKSPSTEDGSVLSYASSSEANSSKLESDASMFDSPLHQGQDGGPTLGQDFQRQMQQRKRKKKKSRKKSTAEIIDASLKKMPGDKSPTTRVNEGAAKSKNSADVRGAKQGTNQKEDGENGSGRKEVGDDTTECNEEVLKDFVQIQGDLYKKEVIAEIEEEYIFPLKRKSVKFPNAKFFCRLCDYHCFDVEHCGKHGKDTRHQRLKKIKALGILLRSLPAPSPAHVEAVDNLLDTVYRTHSLSVVDVQARRSAKQRIEQIIQEINKDLELTLYGSTINGFGLQSSDLNVDFSKDVEPKYLKDIHLKFKSDKSGYLSEVQSDFSAKVPCVIFQVPSTNLKCRFGIHNKGSHRTSELLEAYSQVDPRVTKVGVAFRYLAQLCTIDRQDSGTLPSYVFSLMTVFFLQQCKPPVVPVLHEIQKPKSKSPAMEDYYFKDLENLDKYWKSRNKSSAAKLWIQMLRFYAVEFDMNQHVISVRQLRLLNRQEKKFASKKLAIEDPFMRKWNVARSVSHGQVFEYIHERIRAAYQYFGIPQTASGPLYSDLGSLQLDSKLRQKLRQEHDVADRGDTNVSDGSSSENLKASASLPKDGRDQEAAISEPNVEREEETLATVAQGIVSKVLIEAAKIYQKQVETSRDKHERTGRSTKEEDSNIGNRQNHSLSPQIIGESEQLEDCECTDAVTLTINSSDNSNGTPEATKLLDLSALDQMCESSRICQKQDSEPPDLSDEGDSEVRSRQSSPQSETESPHSKADTEPCPDESIIDFKGHQNLSLEDMDFRFDEETLSDAKGPAVMCAICQKEGHLKATCPEENLPPPAPLPALNKPYRKVLNEIISSVPGDFAPKDHELQMRQRVVGELEEAIISNDFPDARLELFGSSCNGFGFRGSDLDLCLTFEDIASPENIDAVVVIERLAKVLKKQRWLYNVFPITTAKVPIVKFRHRASGLEGDISLYNTLAIENTRMLQLYSELDERVRIIGYTMKVFAKICDICDASKGSLSSYAYTLLVLHFLQQRQPPVIPVLQELYPVGKTKPTNIIDGWNAWFCRDRAKIQKLWPDYKKNKESVADLWIGLIRYYTEEFNVRDYVICVRQKAPLTKFEKLWNNRTVAIEDPFDLGHNLGGGLSRKMNMFIVRTFRNARTVWGTPKTNIPNGYKHFTDYLFDPQILTDSQPPTDRNCHVCGKIGHFAKECPIQDARKERERNEQARKQERNKQKAKRSEQAQNQETQAKPLMEIGRSAPQKIPQRAQTQQQGAQQHQAQQRFAQFAHSPPADYHSPQANRQREYQRSHSQPNAIQPLMFTNTRYEHIMPPPGFGKQGLPVGHQGSPHGHQGSPRGHQGSQQGHQGSPRGQQNMQRIHQGSPQGSGIQRGQQVPQGLMQPQNIHQGNIQYPQNSPQAVHCGPQVPQQFQRSGSVSNGPQQNRDQQLWQIMHQLQEYHRPQGPSQHIPTPEEQMFWQSQERFGCTRPALLTEEQRLWHEQRQSANPPASRNVQGDTYGGRHSGEEAKGLPHYDRSHDTRQGYDQDFRRPESSRHIPGFSFPQGFVDNNLDVLQMMQFEVNQHTPQRKQQPGSQHRHRNRRKSKQK